MKSAFVHFFTSNQVAALSSTLLIFFLTIFLVAKRWIGISVAFILLLSSLLVGVLVNNPQFFNEYMDTQGAGNNLEQQNEFKKLILQALDDIKSEVHTEKENLHQLKDQVHDMITQVDTLKQKLETFIEETRHQFETEKSNDSKDESKESLSTEA